MPFGPAPRLGVSLFDETPPVEWVPGLSADEAETIISAVYRQVLGNAYVMESERLAVEESQFKRGELSVRSFVRAVAKSGLYRDRFFTSCARYRAIELNFRHLLGRAPLDLEEMRAHSTILDTKGFEAEIDSYLDSDEYQTTFGECFVPYIRGYKTEACQSMAQFTHLFKLVRGASTSSLKADLAGTKPKLNRLTIASLASTVTSPADFCNPYVSKEVPRVDAGAPGQLGIQRFEAVPRVEWVPGLSADEKETIISSVYRQVLGNAYVMESERLTIQESQFKRGELSVRGFVRAVAKSDLYRDRFFTSCPRYRAIELNFRHLLGRAPLDLEEMRSHSTILDTKGFEADIDSYLDSDEYFDNFGQHFVPYIRGHKSEACQSMAQFTHTFELVGGPSSSSLKGDLAGKRPKLNSLTIQETPKTVISSASAGAAFRTPADSARTRLGAGSAENGKTYRIEVTGYRANSMRRVSRFRRSNKVYLVSFSELSETYKKIHREGGTIASITQV